MDEDALRTFMCEAANIINSRPLYPADVDDFTSEVPSPNHLLTMKSRLMLPPPGICRTVTCTREDDGEWFNIL